MAKPDLGDRAQRFSQNQKESKLRVRWTATLSVENENVGAGTVHVCVEWRCCRLKEISFRCLPFLGQWGAATTIPAVLKAKLILARHEAGLDRG